jgi:hypothetical protein
MTKTYVSDKQDETNSRHMHKEENSKTPIQNTDTKKTLR